MGERVTDWLAPIDAMATDLEAEGGLLTRRVLSREDVSKAMADGVSSTLLVTIGFGGLTPDVRQSRQQPFPEPAKAPGRTTPGVLWTLTAIVQYDVVLYARNQDLQRDANGEWFPGVGPAIATILNTLTGRQYGDLDLPLRPGPMPPWEADNELLRFDIPFTSTGRILST